jgi:hypothetical protein
LRLCVGWCVCVREESAGVVRFSSGGQLSVEVEVVELDKVESRPGEIEGLRAAGMQQLAA